MARMVGMMLVLVLLEGVCSTAPAWAQAPSPPATVADGTSTNPLPDLPHPLDVPRSLMAPAPACPPGAVTPERPYFERDALLDPPQLPQPGWFALAEVEVLNTHFKNRLVEQVSTDGTTKLVHAPGADLDWNVAPRVQIGYRLESGFGEFALSYRGLATSGSATGEGTDGPAYLQSHLAFNIMDLDYASREFSLWPHWDMKWRIGARAAIVYYDAQEQESIAEAAAGSGILDQRNTNYYVGAGPHIGLELARHFECSGLALAFRADGADLMGQLRQGFFATATGPDAAPSTGQTHDTGPQDVPVVMWELGFSWQPPDRKQLQFFAGYMYEYWWNIGRDSNAGLAISRGEMSDQGLVFRASINY